MKKLIIIFATALSIAMMMSAMAKKPSANNNLTKLETKITKETKTPVKVDTAKNQKSDTTKVNNDTTKKTSPQEEDASVQTVSSIQKYTFPAKKPVRAKKSKDKYVVKVLIPDQKIEVYKNNSLIKEMPCSTGVDDEDKETPVGNFKINGYFGESFYSAKYDQGARYWVGFIGSTYLFHSVPTDEKGKIIPEEADKIGNPASHGCIRLYPQDAFWFYENVPQGANVVISD